MGGKVTAVVVAAGRGSRMESEIQKQYLNLAGKPMLYYALRAFEQSAVDEIVLVTGAEEILYCRERIVDRYGFQKVTSIVEGGGERYLSVYEGLKAADGCKYVLIHDGARPLVTEKIISDAIEGAQKYRACAVGMPVKDTIKIVDRDGFAEMTPARDTVWMVQTPQAFEYALVRGAYENLFSGRKNLTAVTDDAMVVESQTSVKVRMVAGAYTNLKVTTPEDMMIAERFMEEQ